jgi:hypothetical protein
MARVTDGPEHDPFVDAVEHWATSTNKEQPLDGAAKCVLLQGFIGGSRKDRHVRVYRTADLASYVDVSLESIVYHQRLPEAVSPLGGSALWLDPKSFVQLAPQAPITVTAEALRDTGVTSTGCCNPNQFGGVTGTGCCNPNQFGGVTGTGCCNPNQFGVTGTGCCNPNQFGGVTGTGCCNPNQFGVTSTGCCGKDDRAAPQWIPGVGWA